MFAGTEKVGPRDGAGAVKGEREETLEGQQERRAVLITGGTSGIGLAAAQRFAAAGDCVLIAGRDAAA